jgi:hypothetical protein
MAALGTHNRQLTLSLWWACSALKLERERANELDDSEFGNYRSDPSPLTPPEIEPLHIQHFPGWLALSRSSAMGLHQKVAHHQQRPQEPEGVLANAMNAQVGMYGEFKGFVGQIRAIECVGFVRIPWDSTYPNVGEEFKQAGPVLRR